MKTFYRVAHKDSEQGLWYCNNGDFTGFIHDRFNFCKNSALEMPFDTKVVGFLSATDSLEDLFNWFPEEDILKLEPHGYFITVYQTNHFKWHNNHWLIDQERSKKICTVTLEKPKKILQL